MNKYPENEIIKPFIPKAFSIVGLFCFVFVFSVCGAIGIRSTLPIGAILMISLCLGVAGEVSASMLQYALDLQTRTDIIFVPKSIGLIGKVYKDIPAAESGEGAIRLFMNGAVTHINALSVDEVVLAKGTEVRVLYASSDTVVVVERYLKKAGIPTSQEE